MLTLWLSTTPWLLGSHDPGSHFHQTSHWWTPTTMSETSLFKEHCLLHRSYVTHPVYQPVKWWSINVRSFTVNVFYHFVLNAVDHRSDLVWKVGWIILTGLPFWRTRELLQTALFNTGLFESNGCISLTLDGMGHDVLDNHWIMMNIEAYWPGADMKRIREIQMIMIWRDI